MGKKNKEVDWLNEILDTFSTIRENGKIVISLKLSKPLHDKLLNELKAKMPTDAQRNGYGDITRLFDVPVTIDVFESYALDFQVQIE